MARLLTTGFEVQEYTTSIATNGEGQSTLIGGTVTADTTHQWSGRACAKMAPGAQNIFTYQSLLTRSRGYYVQTVVKHEGTESAPNNYQEFFKVETLSEEVFEIGIFPTSVGSEAGKFYVWSQHGWEFVSTVKAEVGKHYIIEAYFLVPESGTGSIQVRIRDENGVLLYDSTLRNQNLGTVAPEFVFIGHRGSDTNWTSYFSQLLINDSTGEHENSWVGYQKVTFMRATADELRQSGWKNGAAGTTELARAIRNFPPAGLATGASSAKTQIKNSVNSATEIFEFGTPAYNSVEEGGGMMASTDTIKTRTWLARGANSTTTSRNLGLEGTRNPVAAAVTHATGTALGNTEPTGWGTFTCAPIYGEAGEWSLTSKATASLKKATASTDVAMFDLAGLYVTFEPATEEAPVTYTQVVSGTSASVGESQDGFTWTEAIAGTSASSLASTDLFTMQESITGESASSGTSVAETVEGSIITAEGTSTSTGSEADTVESTESIAGSSVSTGSEVDVFTMIETNSGASSSTGSEIDSLLINEVVIATRENWIPNPNTISTSFWSAANATLTYEADPTSPSEGSVLVANPEAKSNPFINPGTQHGITEFSYEAAPWKTWVLSCVLKMDATALAKLAATDCRPSLWYQDSAGSYHTVYGVIPAGLAPEEWSERISVVMTIPPGAKAFFLRLNGAQGKTGKVWFTQVKLEPAAEDGTYFPTPEQEVNGEATFIGTVNASVSILHLPQSVSVATEEDSFSATEAVAGASVSAGSTVDQVTATETASGSSNSTGSQVTVFTLGEPTPPVIAPIQNLGRRRVVNWRFVLVKSDNGSGEMEELGEIKQARNRQVELALDKSGGVQFEVPLDYGLFEGIKEIKHGVIAYRNKVAMHSGMIWNLDEDADNNKLQVQTVGWFETLNHRILRENVGYPPFSTGVVNAGQVVFLPASGSVGSANYHPGGLLTIANAQQDTWLNQGSNTDKMQRILSYTKGQSIGQAISQLSEIEAGFDFWVDPIDRRLSITNWNEVPDKTEEVVFGYNWGPNNMEKLGRQFDPTNMVNRMTALGKYGGGFAENVEAQKEYQLFEEMPQLNEVTDANVLLAYAGGEVLLRGEPRQIFSFVPFPYSGSGREPQPFHDYYIGDKVIFTALKAPRIAIRGQAVRIYGMTIQITDEGNEKLGSLQISPS